MWMQLDKECNFPPERPGSKAGSFSCVKTKKDPETLRQ